MKRKLQVLISIAVILFTSFINPKINLLLKLEGGQSIYLDNAVKLKKVGFSKKVLFSIDGNFIHYTARFKQEVTLKESRHSFSPASDSVNLICDLYVLNDTNNLFVKTYKSIYKDYENNNKDMEYQKCLDTPCDSFTSVGQFCLENGSIYYQTDEFKANGSYIILLYDKAIVLIELSKPYRNKYLNPLADMVEAMFIVEKEGKINTIKKISNGTLGCEE
jgi:hypothetical protein